jgi:hypothetical protein
MPTITPYAGLSNNRLTAMINQDNGGNLQEGVDFTYGVPSTIEGNGGRNTTITLTPVPGSQYTAPQNVNYWRLGIDILGNLPEGSLDVVPVPTAPNFSIHSILGYINASLGLMLTPDEVENTVYTESQDTYTLTILPGSLAWAESSYDFAAAPGDGAVPLASVVIETALEGLDYVEPA